MATKTWNGSDDNWDAAGDWTPAGVPGSSDYVEIGSGTPLIDQTTGDIVAGDIEVGGRASISFREATGEVHGELDVNTFTHYGELPGVVSIDADSGDLGGTMLTIDGALYNQGYVNIGNSSLSADTVVTVATITNASRYPVAATISISGAADHSFGARLNVTTGLAGFGTAGQLQGDVKLFDDALIDFEDSGQITTNMGSLLLDGTKAFLASGPNVTSNSALVGLASNIGSISLANGASMTITDGLTNKGHLALDVSDEEGGSTLNIGGTLTNLGGLRIGDNSLSASTTVKVGALVNSGYVDLYGSTASMHAAVLNIASAAGFGKTGILGGIVGLYDDARIDFKGGGQITSIGGRLTLEGANAFIASGTDTTGNNALAGLTTINGSGQLNLENDASLDLAHAVKNLGMISLDYPSGGGASLTTGALTNTGSIHIGNSNLAGATSLSATQVSNSGSIELFGSSNFTARATFSGSMGGAGGTIQLDSHASISLSGAVVGQTIRFNGQNDLLSLGAATTFLSPITGFGDADTIDLSNETVSSLSYAAGKLTLRLSTGAIQQISVKGTFSGLEATSDGQGGTDITTAPATQVFLTADADTPSLNDIFDVVNATSSTLNSSDKLVGGSGTDMLALTGGGAYDLATLMAFSGIAGVTLDDIDSTLTLRAGSTLTITSGAGNDTFVAGTGAFTAATVLDGGAGHDTLELNGNYASGVTFTATTLTNVETITLGTGHSYKLIIDNSTVAAGAKLTVTGSTLAAGNTLTFDGSAETDGSLSLAGGAGADVLTGGAGDDALNGAAGADTMSGGAGNDTYYVDNPGDVVIEAANGGSDTVISSITTYLTANVENLALSGTDAHNAAGNVLANVIRGNVNANVITGGGGNDTLTGGGGMDTFVYHAGFGKDAITDFTAGTAQGHDTLQVDHTLFANYTTLMAHMTNSGANAVITLDANNSITLDHVQKAQLVAGDFKFV